MIGFLRGTVVYTTEDSVVLETSGVGYEVNVSESILLSVKKGDSLDLFIYHHITEVGQSLYGFTNLDARKFFMLLISVSGIGPKSALSIMEVQIDTIVNAILQENIAALTELPGVGKKTAERIVLELKNKVTGITPQEVSINVEATTGSEAIDALLSLGYSRLEAGEMLGKIPEDIVDTQDIVKYALQHK